MADLNEMLYGEPRVKRLSRRQNKLLRALCDPAIPTIAAAGRVAGYSGPGAAGVAARAPSMQHALAKFLEVLESCGVTDLQIAKTISEGLRADKTVLASFEGYFTDEREVPDHATRQKYIDLVLKLRKLITNDTPGGGEKPPINIQIVNYDAYDAPPAA